MSTEDRHREMVASLVKDGAQIKDEMTPQQAHLLHMAAGAAGEGGELLDAIKKHSIYQKPLDLENVIEELGDLEFFMEGLRDALGIQREVTLAANMRKLSKRYSSGSFSNAEAQNRADKAEDPLKGIGTNKIVVLYGPMASGKTRNAEAIAAHFGCTNIVDNFASGGAVGGGASTPGYPVIAPGTLLIVTASEVSAYALRKAIVEYCPEALNTLMAIVSISEALAAIAPAEAV